GVRRGGEVLRVGRGADERALGGVRPAGAGGDRAERQAHIPHDAVVHLERGGDRADGEGGGGAFTHLAVAGAGGDRGGRQGDRGDQRAPRQRRLAVRGVRDRQVEVGQRQLPRPVGGLVGDDGVERGQRHGHVGGVHGHAVLGGAEDGVIADRKSTRLN